MLSYISNHCYTINNSSDFRQYASSCGLFDNFVQLFCFFTKIKYISQWSVMCDLASVKIQLRHLLANVNVNVKALTATTTRLLTAAVETIVAT